MNTHTYTCVYAHTHTHTLYTSHTKIKNEIYTVEERMEAWFDFKRTKTSIKQASGWYRERGGAGGEYHSTVAQQLIGDGAWKCISLGVSFHIDQQGHVFFSRDTVKRLILPASWNPGSYLARFPASFRITWSQMDSNG